MTPKLQKSIQMGEEIVIPDLGPQYKNAQKLLEDMLTLDPDERDSIKKIIKKIDAVYPDLKP